MSVLLFYSDKRGFLSSDVTSSRDDALWYASLAREAAAKVLMRARMLICSEMGLPVNDQ